MATALAPRPKIILHRRESGINFQAASLLSAAREASHPPAMQTPELSAHGVGERGKVQAVIVAKLDRLTRSVKDLCGSSRTVRGARVALISVSEALDTGSPQGVWGSLSWVPSANGSAKRLASGRARRCGKSPLLGPRRAFIFTVI